MSTTCQSANRAGERCGMAALSGSDFCWAHSPEHVLEREIARKRGGQNSRPTIPVEEAPVVRLRDREQILAAVERALGANEALRNSTARNRTVATLAKLALEINEASRMDELQRQITELRELIERRGAA